MSNLCFTLYYLYDIHLGVQSGRIFFQFHLDCDVLFCFFVEALHILHFLNSCLARESIQIAHNQLQIYFRNKGLFLYKITTVEIAYYDPSASCQLTPFDI